MREWNKKIVGIGIASLLVLAVYGVFQITNLNQAHKRKPVEAEQESTLKEDTDTEVSASIMGVQHIIVTLSELQEQAKTQTTKVEEEPKKKSAYDGKFVVNMKKEYLSVRKKADKNSKVVGKLYQGTAGKIVKSGEKWTKIKSGNVVGYVKTAYIVTGEEAEKLAKKVAKIEVIVQENGIRVRQRPDKEATILSTAYAGEVYTGIKEIKNWVKIEYNGESAFIAKEYVKINRILGKGITIKEEQEIKRAEKAKKEAEEAARREAEEQAKQQVEVQEAQQEPEVVKGKPMKTEVDEEYLLACLVTSEAGSECYEGQLAVANIVLNRVRSGRYGSSIREVIYAPGQFTVVSNGMLDAVLSSGPNDNSVAAANDALAGTNNVKGYYSFHSYRGGSCNYSKYQIIGNQVFY